MPAVFRHLFILLLLCAPAAAQRGASRPDEVVNDILAGDARKGYVTRVRIAGTHTISENDALGLIGTRLEHVRRQPPSAARASDAAFMARTLFRSHGFNQCEVAYQITGPGVIQLIVKEGPRQDVGKVTVEGVDKETAARLAKLYKSPSEKRRFGAGQRPPFRESDIEEGLALLVADFHSRGYWTGTATVKQRTARPGESEIDFVIATNPGPLHYLAAPTIEGAGENRNEVAGVAQAFVGKPADTASVNGLRAAIQTWYRKRGFTKAKILLTSTLEGNRFIPGLIIEQGKSYRLGSISFAGLGKTKPWRLRQRFADMEGKTLDDTVMEKRVRGLMATGAFKTVRLENVQRNDDIVDATLRFEEGEARGYSASVGFGTYEGPILGVGYYDRNFTGRLYNFNSGFEITARSILGEVSLTDPWLWGTDASATARLFLLTKDHEGYNTWKAGLEAGVVYPITPHYTLEARAGWGFVNTNSDEIPGNLLGETVYQNPYLRVTQKFDYRDSPVLPTTGWNVEIPLELGGVLGEVSSTYFKAEINGAWRRPVGEKGAIVLAGRGGSLFSSSDIYELPIDLRYFLGGASTVRSYAERELGPHSRTGYPVGGQTYWVTNAEYIHKITGPVKLVGFVDVGAMAPQGRNFSGVEPDIAAGLGLRVDLPVGPLRLEYGHNLTQDPGEPSGAWHFAIGAAF